MCPCRPCAGVFRCFWVQFLARPARATRWAHQRNPELLGCKIPDLKIPPTQRQHAQPAGLSRACGSTGTRTGTTHWSVGAQGQVLYAPNRARGMPPACKNAHAPGPPGLQKKRLCSTEVFGWHGWRADPWLKAKVWVAGGSTAKLRGKASSGQELSLQLLLPTQSGRPNFEAKLCAGRGVLATARCLTSTPAPEWRTSIELGCCPLTHLLHAEVVDTARLPRP